MTMAGESSGDVYRSGASRPLPDPSDATTALLLREIGSLKELNEQRFDAIEKAVEVARADVTRMPTETMKAVGALRELIDSKFEVHAEKFAGVERQFRERDTRIEQTAKDAKTAIDAALLAAEKAVGKQQDANNEATRKSDFSFTKQIDQQGTLIAAVRDGLNASIGEAKERISRVESNGQGRNDQRTEQRDDTKVWMAVAGVVLTLIGLLAGYLARR